MNLFWSIYNQFTLAELKKKDLHPLRSITVAQVYTEQKKLHVVKNLF